MPGIHTEAVFLVHLSQRVVLNKSRNIFIFKTVGQRLKGEKTGGSNWVRHGLIYELNALDIGYLALI